ncbi:hypothetical protein [Nocardia sp. alder85J]|uniref:hypothetical protein n=1 Tax=Nocardia sp. alder85J TaxID=2862949 RepID=UPI001CD403B0|nr:hypothetical protein [Nocardia sp. alder85J]MCX4097469.1 hypothetical protein [Nocardia sp. alder85J]
MTQSRRVQAQQPRRGSRPAAYEGGPSGRAGAPAGRRRTFGAPDLFVYFPVAGILLAAGLVATIGASILLGVVLVLIAVVLVVFDSWANR